MNGEMYYSRYSFVYINFDFYFILVSNIIWDGSPLTLRYDNSQDEFTSGGGAWPGKHYKNLPSFLADQMPLFGNSDINTAEQLSVSLPSKVDVYMFITDGWRSVDMTGWTKLSEGPYINGYDEIQLYRKTFEAGEYIFDNDSAMYLFVLGN